MSSPLVSVLVITYNQEHLVRETLASCLNQSFDDYEIVVSDDGSSDATPTILREIQRENPTLVKLVLNPHNQGITANCNAGLAECSGSLIALVGGDDLLMPEKLKRQTEAFAANPRLVLSYHPSRVLRNGRMSEVVGNRAKDVIRSQLDMIGNFGAQLPGPATMVRSSAVPADGFNADIKTASDWMFFIDVTSNGSVERIDQTLGIYRQHGGNIGARYFTYTDDFLTTLELTGRKYGHLSGVHKAIRKGGSRFLFGAIYRSIEQGRNDLTKGYARELEKFAPRGLAVALGALAVVPGVGWLFRRSKGLLKRFV